jgi:hypothetical protein
MLFEDILEQIVRARDRGDIEVLTVRQIVARMESVRERPLRDRADSLTASGTAL